MSRRYNAHISLVANPLQLMIEGLQISTQKLEAHLKEITDVCSSLSSRIYLNHTFAKNIVEDFLELPTKTPIRSDLIQRLSRLAGAFIQNLDEHGKVSMSIV
jgi:hypothetical protein